MTAGRHTVRLGQCRDDPLVRVRPVTSAIEHRRDPHYGPRPQYRLPTDPAGTPVVRCRCSLGVDRATSSLLP